MPEPTTTEPTAAKRSPLTSALVEVARLHGKAKLASYAGSTSSLSERVGGSKPGSRELAFGADQPLSVELERSFQRFADYWAARVKAESEGRPRDAQRARTQAILAEVGVDATAVAFVYCSTTEAVKKLRGRAGLDPETGQTKRAMSQERIDGKASRQRPLTAPPRAVIDEVEARAAADGDDPDFT